MSRSIFTYLFCFITWLSSGQDKRLKFVGIETGVDGAVEVETKQHDFIRGEMVTYSGDVTNNLKGSMYKKHVGAKIELMSTNNKFGLSAGLRYTRINSSLGKDNTWGSTSKYFYLLYSQTATTTEYFKIRGVNQKSDYIGIPIHLRYYPFGEHRFTIYFKLGVEFNYLINTKTDVSFVDYNMEQYSNVVENKFGDPETLTTIINAGGGLRIGRNTKWKMSIEIGPSIFSNKVSSLVDSFAAFGAQFNFQVPL